LVTADEFALAEDRQQQLGQSLQETVDLDRLLAVTEAPPLDPKPVPLPAAQPPCRRVAVARDAAFCFYYPENLELLQAAGGEIVPFSPLADSALPPDTDLVYLGGGYPELRAQALAENESMRRAIRSFHQQGGTIYAECGGLMYVGRELIDISGQAFPMLNLLPVRTVMQSGLAGLGYVKVRTTRPTPLGPPGISARGHQFHYSRSEILGPVIYGTELDRDRGALRPDALVSDNLLAGYAHLHFGSNPGVARALLGVEKDDRMMV
jgi:cobyrinic acid a,c-diamide synthase